jgi:hypothetical protein
MNPLINDDKAETVESVRNVIEFLAWHRLEGEETKEIADGRRLILQCCSEALASTERGSQS